MNWDEMELWERNMLVHKHVMGNPGSGIPDYTTDMRVAWEVLREMECQDELHSAFAYHLGATFATPEGFDTFRINLEQLAKLTPEKICKAALKAHGVSI